MVTWILRSILVLFSVFAAKRTGKLDFLVLLVMTHFALCSLLLFSGPDNSYAATQLCLAGFAGVHALRALFPSFVSVYSSMLVLSGTCYAPVQGFSCFST